MISLDEEEEYTILISPLKRVSCPRCGLKVEIRGGGSFFCIDCSTKFDYLGPFKLICHSCSSKIELTTKPNEIYAHCPDCEQKYKINAYPNLKIYSHKPMRFTCQTKRSDVDNEDPLDFVPQLKKYLRIKFLKLKSTIR
ncbi:MAG: hypothetical protein ACFFDT_06075 [Candidatus Hodarchaeota archaeon]